MADLDTSSASPDRSGGEPDREPLSQASDESIRRLANAVTRLVNDPEYFLQALTDTLEAMEPVSKEKLPENEKRFLIEHGGMFTEETWAKTHAEVQRGRMHVHMVEGWLSSLFETYSLDHATAFLGWDEAAVRTAVAEDRLYAIEISGRLRFPAWQFNIGSPSKLLPGLAEVIEVVKPRWDWQSVAGFMATPQPELVAERRQTPVAWLRGGGDIDEIKQIVKSSDWDQAASMPRRRRHEIVETPEIEAAIDLAGEHWPELAGKRTALVRKLIERGSDSLQREESRGLSARERQIEDAAGGLTGVFPPNALGVLREDWSD